ncbi:hypothetical protein [Paenibacillus apis]|nr:hypothetical protein [Paenibacillus apis]
MVRSQVMQSGKIAGIHFPGLLTAFLRGGKIWTTMTNARDLTDRLA